MAWWLWVMLGLALAGVELMAGGELYFLLFGAAAAVVGVVAFIGLLPELWMQVALLAALAVGAVLPLRKRLSGKMQAALPDRAVDSIAGETAVAEAEIAPGKVGRVRLRGSTWSAQNLGAQAVSAGETVLVERVEGLKLFVRAEEGGR